MKALSRFSGCWFFAAGLWGVLGCSHSAVYNETAGARNGGPQLEYRGVVFKPESFRDMKIQFQFGLVDPEHTFRVVACPYRLELDGIEPIEGVTHLQSTPSDGGIPLITTVVGIPWPKDPSEIIRFLSKEKLRYGFTQTCNASGGTSVTASDSGNMPLPRLPRLAISGANAQRFGAGEARLSFELSVINENGFSVRIDKVFYKILLEEKPLAEGELPIAESVPANHETTYDIPTEIRSGVSSKEILDLMGRQQISYRLEGRVYFGEYEVLVSGNGNISFSR
jgi:LEA14-like dessication related protein